MVHQHNNTGRSVIAAMERWIDLDLLPVRSVLSTLLLDRTTGENIIWATDTYAAHGEGYGAKDPIAPALVTGENSGVIQPRTAKATSDQADRTRKHAEVFTPAWVCNLMVNHCDGLWFGREDVFNTSSGRTWTPADSPIAFPERKGWRMYVDSRRLEITCGEAPFLVSRYDAVTGERIPFDRRVGMLDRKLRAVNENAADEAEWLKYAFRALESVYGYEYQGDSLLIARVNVLMTFLEAVRARWKREATARELGRAANILSWNLWQMDGLKGTVPFGSLREANTQVSMWDLLGEASPPAEDVRPPCQIYDWRGKEKLTYNDRKRRTGSEMKFDFVIGNPPYQEETESESTRMPPIYNLFMEEAFKIAKKTELITPARFLFNAGYTPKAWNEKMLNDRHFKVLYYEQISEKIFPGTDIKGGIIISYRDESKDFGAIETFTKYPELNGILVKVKAFANGYLDRIIHSNLSFKVSERMKEEHPDLIDRLRTNAFTALSKIFHEKPPKDGHNYIAMIGLINTKRATRYIRRDYIQDSSGTLDKYTLLLPSVNGAGHFGETLSSTIIAPPRYGYTQTFIGIGSFDTEQEAKNVDSYVRTRFARTMLGILKTTQHCPGPKWAYVPLQDFTPHSDIDWSVSIPEIDRQLYRKYSLSDEEISFIESHVKEMA